MKEYVKNAGTTHASLRHLAISGKRLLWRRSRERPAAAVLVCRSASATALAAPDAYIKAAEGVRRGNGDTLSS
jgi:hypothetical protein